MLAEAQDVGEQNLQMYVCEIYIDISHTVVINSWSRMLEWGKNCCCPLSKLINAAAQGKWPWFLREANTVCKFQVLCKNSNLP